MPGNKRRSDYHKGVRSREDLKKLLFEWPSLSEEDWIALEKALGAELTPNQRMLIDRLSAHVKSWENLTRNAIGITALRKKIRAVRNAVLRYREDIWHIYRPRELQMALPVEDVDELFFMKRFRIPAKDGSPLELLGWAMDAVIMTCSSVEQAIKAPAVGLKERDSIVMMGAVIRASFKEWGLPYTIRKDVDKQKVKNGSGSKFLDFYIELLERIGCPWPLSSAALATAISRFNLS
jgi:hypothetical protein